MKRRLYLDETVWLALACEGDLRDAVRRRLRLLMGEGWIPVTSTFALDRLIGMEGDPARLTEFLAIARRIADEVYPLQSGDFDSAVHELLVRSASLNRAIHFCIARRCRSQGMCSFAAGPVPPGLTSVSPV